MKYQLLDFWADWCTPCKMMNPIIDKIEKDYPNIEVVRINADEDSAMVQKYNILTVPTYILEKDGEIISFVKGAMPEYRFKKELGLDALKFGENSTNAS
jgi:thioredoxin 1